MHQHINATTEALKAAPAVGGATASMALAPSPLQILGLSLSEWAALATFVYVVVQCSFFLHDRYTIWRSKRDSQPSEPPQS